MSAIFKREFNAYFTSPIGYVYLAVFYCISGFLFFANTLAMNTTDLSGVFNSLFVIAIILVPILTMRLMSEDKKHRTDQALLTAPISLLGLAMGKYLAALTVYLLGISMTLVYGIVVALFATPDWAVILGNFVGLLLLGAAMIAVGMFISALTESQIVAVVGTVAISLLLMMIDMFASLMPTQWLQSLIYGLSFAQHYDNFTAGVLNFSSIIFFLSVCAVFIFLTVRAIEKKRWS